MDLIDRLSELASRIERQKDSVMTEEACKTAFVLPFVQSLGYDVFNPSEVIPEFTADHGTKKGEKVDYAIRRDGVVTILVECKPLGAALAAKHAGQLFRYFSVTDARFGVLTDGVRYLFFSDLEHENKMDDRPFFIFNMLEHQESDVEELKKFSKSGFDLETIISTANKLKYHRALLSEVRSEFSSPSDDLVRLFTAKVYSGRFTQQVRDDFAPLVQRAIKEYVREYLNQRITSALEPQSGDSDQKVASVLSEDIAPNSSDDSGIETTEDEMHGHRIIQAICSEVTEAEHIVMRDAKSYCAILFDNNNRKPICRLHFGKSRLAVTIFLPDGEQRVDLEAVNELFKHKGMILAAVGKYIEPKEN